MLARLSYQEAGEASLALLSPQKINTVDLAGCIVAALYYQDIPLREDRVGLFSLMTCVMGHHLDKSIESQPGVLQADDRARVAGYVYQLMLACGDEAPDPAPLKEGETPGGGADRVGWKRRALRELKALGSDASAAGKEDDDKRLLPYAGGGAPG